MDVTFSRRTFSRHLLLLLVLCGMLSCVACSQEDNNSAVCAERLMDEEAVESVFSYTDLLLTLVDEIPSEFIFRPDPDAVYPEVQIDGIPLSVTVSDIQGMVSSYELRAYLPLTQESLDKSKGIAARFSRVLWTSDKPIHSSSFLVLERVEDMQQHENYSEYWSRLVNEKTILLSIGVRQEPIYHEGELILEINVKSLMLRD